MKDKILIYAVAGTIIFFLGFIAHVQYFQTKDNLISLYSNKQQVVASQAAYSIQKVLMERIKAVEILRSIWENSGWDYSKLTTEFALAHNLIEGFKFLFIVDSLGNSIAGYPDGFPCPSKQPDSIRVRFLEVLKQARAENKTLIFEKNAHVNQKIYICIICPIPDRPRERAGAIIGVLDVNSIIHHAVEPIINENFDLVWAMNEKGLLIFHSYHGQQIMKSLFTGNKICHQCHSGFEAEKSMLTTKHGTIIEKIAGKKYLVGYADLQAPNLKWLVGISTSFETITGALRSEFKSFLFLIIFIILTVFSGAVIFNRINSKNILARKELENLRIQHKLIKEKTAAESRYRILVEQSPDPIFLCTRKKMLMVNPAFEKVFEIDASKVYSENFAFEKLIDENSKEKFQNTIIDFIKKRKTTTLISSDLRTFSARKIKAEISLSRFKLNNSIVYQGIIHDVTRTRQLEREQERRKNLALIGEMAARIAHEIKNPLASIQTGIQLLETRVPGDSREKRYYDRLLKEIQRVDTILKGLLTYARQDIIVRKRTNIRALIERFAQVIQPTMEQSKIKFSVEVSDDLPEVWLDEQRFEQVLWNITLNAIQASKAGSTIYCKVLRNARTITIQICDEGDGIPGNVLEKIFDPFFSTKTHGSGLGLAISKKIIEQHGGKLKIFSEEKKGTIVSILLPLNVKGEV